MRSKIVSINHSLIEKCLTSNNFFCPEIFEKLRLELAHSSCKPPNLQLNLLAKKQKEVWAASLVEEEVRISA
jgi:hypothetical protein